MCVFPKIKNREGVKKILFCSLCKNRLLQHFLLFYLHIFMDKNVRILEDILVILYQPPGAN